MNTITVNRVNELLAQGYKIWTEWSFNMTSDTGSIGHREYQTFMSKDGRITLAK